MRKVPIMAAALVLLSGCDQHPKSSDVTIKGQDGSVTISANGQHFAINANGGNSGSFAMSGSDGHFTMKASDRKQGVEIDANGSAANLVLPAFAAAYPGAKVQSTTVGSGANGTSGTVTFETKDSPAAVIAFYRSKAAGAGLAQAVDMNMGATTMFSANADGGKRALQVVAASSSGGAHVQVNWTGK